jgi:hypothetical protein
VIATTYALVTFHIERMCTVQQPPLASNSTAIAGSVTRLGNLGAIKALSLHSNLSVVNNFYKNRGSEPVALGDMVAHVRKGLAASQVILAPTPIRVPLPAQLILLASLRAEAVRLELPQLGTTEVPLTKIELLRAYVANTVVFFLLSRGGAEIECLTRDLVTTQQGGIITHHRNMKGQRGVGAKHRPLCAILESAHSRVASLSDFFDN